MEKSIRFKARKLHLGMGWYKGEYVALLHVDVFQFNDGYIDIFNLKILKFSIDLWWGEI